MLKPYCDTGKWKGADLSTRLEALVQHYCTGPCGSSQEVGTIRSRTRDTIRESVAALAASESRAKRLEEERDVNAADRDTYARQFMASRAEVKELRWQLTTFTGPAFDAEPAECGGGMGMPEERDYKDELDQEIYRHGQTEGQYELELDSLRAALAASEGRAKQAEAERDAAKSDLGRLRLHCGWLMDQWERCRNRPTPDQPRPESEPAADAGGGADGQD